MKKVIYLISITLFFFGCKGQLTREDLSIVDDISLGITMSDFNKQGDSLNIKGEYFVTTPLALTKDALLYEKYTTRFNYSLYESRTTKHLGLLQPTLIAGSDIVVGLNIILVHTEKINYNKIDNRLIDEELKSRTDEVKFITQVVNESTIHFIINDYTAKYGKPEIDTVDIKVPVIMIGEIGEMVTGPMQNFKWKTKHMNINLFFSSPDTVMSKFNTVTRSYREAKDSVGSGNFYGEDRRDEIETVYLAFINYQLNDDVCKTLGIWGKKI